MMEKGREVHGFLIMVMEIERRSEGVMKDGDDDECLRREWRVAVEC